MMIVLILISVLLWIYFYYAWDEDMVVIPITGIVIKLGVIIYLLICLIGTKVIDEKIELFTSQNEVIESKVASVVKEYMEHENKTYKELKTNESYITLVTLYPELKSDKLIEKEIDLYEDNNKKILDLKEQKINKYNY